MHGSHRITVSNLIDSETGKLNRYVYDRLVRREAMRTWGSTAPRYLREAAKYYRDHIVQQRLAWMRGRGIEIRTVNVVPFGRPQAGLRYSAF